MAFQRQRRGRRGPGQEAFAREEGGLEDNVVQIYRCSKVVKGGRRFSFAALVVVGDRGGNVGIGYGKAKEVPLAVEKGIAEAKKKLEAIALKGRTIPHKVIGRHGASTVVLVPASEGTGVIAGKKLRPLLELAGIHNVLTKAYGSTSPKNLLKAGIQALKQLRTAETIAALRGVVLS
ncbi:MAG TPA: 30S ribosomal protein S5 [Phycisphaerae bacterium]|nr:30S ribosomal protein S5 [Phycisphaerae bacterium]